MQIFRKVEKTGSFWDDYNNIDEAIKSTWRDLMNFNHPLLGVLPGPENCRIDVLPLNFLSGAMETEKDGFGYIVPAINIFWIKDPGNEIPKIVSCLRESCNAQQVKRISVLFARIGKENYLNRTRQRDRRLWIHDIIFEEWNKNNTWAIAMKAIYEQFDISLPQEYHEEWDREI
jgi:hypothetical protein